MSELREAIMDATFTAAYGPSKMGDCSGWVTKIGIEIADVVEAYLREHDAAARQRIEALPTHERMGHSLGAQRARNADEYRADVLEALGDER